MAVQARSSPLFDYIYKGEFTIAEKILSKTQLKYFSKLLHKKYRQEQREYLVEGVRLCQELLQSPLPVKALLYCDELRKCPAGATLLEHGQQRGIPLFRTSAEILQRLTDTRNPQPVVACIPMSDRESDRDFWEARRFLVLVDISDPGNAGTLLRTAEAFGWSRVICVGNTVDIYNPKVVRASMGAVFRLKIAWQTLKETLSSFEARNLPYLVSVPGQGSVPPLNPCPHKLALLLGNEAHGLPLELLARAYTTVQVPMKKGIDSLNVAIAGAILLFLLQ